MRPTPEKGGLQGKGQLFDVPNTIDLTLKGSDSGGKRTFFLREEHTVFIREKERNRAIVSRQKESDSRKRGVGRDQEEEGGALIHGRSRLEERDSDLAAPW